ncbi:MAG: hypothetical protein ACI4AX_05490 [Muribaculaceae bacterium]
MKRAVIISIALIFCLAANCARLRNSIYIFDCTQSMQGNAAKNVPDIWQATKSSLKSRIEREPADARIVIIPFQAQPYPAIIFERRDFDWEKVDGKFEEYIKRLTNTNICDSWTAGEKYIDLTRNNYIYLMTDGVDTDAGRRAKLADVFRQFCAHNYPDTHGFYVRLTENALVEDNIRDIIEGCKNLDIVSPADKTDFGSFDSRVININTHELPCRRIVDFSDPGIFKANATSHDPNFIVDVVDGEIKNGILEFEIRSAYGDDKTRLHDELGDENYDFDITIASDNIHITDPRIEVRVVNRPERVLEFKGIAHDEDDLGKSLRHEGFLFSTATAPDTLSINLAPAFNDEARRDRASVSMKVSSNITGADTNDITILFNGRELADSCFTLKAGDTTPGILSVVFRPSCEDTKLSLSLAQLSSKNLDRIGETPADEFTHSFRAECENEMNPLAKGLLWTASIIIAALILWFALLKRQFFPPISKITTIMITKPYVSQRKVRGARLVVFSDKPVRQGFFNRLFTGRIVSEVNPVWTSRCEMRHARNGVRFSCPDRSMTASPSALMSKFNEYTVMNIKGTGCDITIKTL